ncbi:MAG: hypothetical protein ACK4IT_02300 [Thioalkalivibrionaceae bacterium]
MTEQRPVQGVDWLSPKLLAQHRGAIGLVMSRAKRLGGVLTVLVMLAYVGAAAALLWIDGAAGVWTALIIATLAFLFFRQLPALVLAFSRMPERGRPEQAALYRAIDLALDTLTAREVLRRLDTALATSDASADRQAVQRND